MAFPDVAFQIAKYQLGPLVVPSDSGYVTADGVTDVASHAFSASDTLDLTDNYTLTFDVQVPFIDPADWSGSNPTLVLARIEESSTRILEFGVHFGVGEASGSDVAVMYAFLDGTGTTVSRAVPALAGIDSTPARLIFKYSVDGTGDITFSSRNLNVDPNEFADVASGTFDTHGVSLGFGSRPSAAGTFILGEASTSAPYRFRRCRLPGTTETDFDDHDGTGPYNDGDRSWSVNNTLWRATDWVDVSSLVLHDAGVSITRGRTGDLGAYAPGVASFTLDNQSRVWDPYGSSDVKPWQQVRIRATHSASLHNLFTGFVRSYTPAFGEAGLFPTTVVDCVDGFGLLANHSIGTTATAAALELAPDGYWPHTEAASATTITNAVFGSPDLDYSFTAKTAATDPAWIGGRRTGTFAPIGSATDLPASFTPSGDFTVTAWVHMPPPRTTGLANNDRTNVLAVANASDDFWFCCYLHNEDRLAWGGGVAFLNGASNTYTDGPTLPSLVDETFPNEDERYHHVAWVVNSGGTYDVDFYINGELIGSSAGISVSTPTGTPTLYDGDIKTGGGFIDSLGMGGSGEKSVAGVGYWARALTAEEVAELAANRVDGLVSEISSDRVSRLLDAFGWPAGRDNVQPGQVTLAAVDADGSSYLTALQRAELSEFGDLFIRADGYLMFYDRDYRTDHNNTNQETFDAADTNAAFSAIAIDYSDEQVINLVRLVGTDGTVVRRDEPSIRAGYGVREFARQVDTTASSSQAQQILNRYAEPQPRPRSFVIRPTRDESRLFPQVLGRELTDKVTINIPTVGTDPSLTARISRIQHVFNAAEWTTTWGLEVEP